MFMRSFKLQLDVQIWRWGLWTVSTRNELKKFYVGHLIVIDLKSSQVGTLPKAKSQTRSKQNKKIQKFSSVYSLLSYNPGAISDRNHFFPAQKGELPYCTGGARSKQ
jgi:hypothetical protein